MNNGLGSRQVTFRSQVLRKSYMAFFTRINLSMSQGIPGKFDPFSCPNHDKLACVIDTNPYRVAVVYLYHSGKKMVVYIFDYFVSSFSPEAQYKTKELVNLTNKTNCKTQKNLTTRTYSFG